MRPFKQFSSVESYSRFINSPAPRTLSHTFILKFLYYISLLYRWWMKRNDQKVKTIDALIPIVSVGNIMVGGTGKTPFVMLLLSHLMHEKMSVISTGYRGKKVSKNKVEKIHLSAGGGKCFFGDEPYLIKSNFPSAHVYVCKDRQKAVEQAAHDGCCLAIFDDGFQYHKTKKNIDIVMMNAHNLCGNGYLLPRGFLREELSSLVRANYIVIRYRKDSQEFEKAVKTLSPFTKAHMMGCIWQPQGFKGQAKLTIEAIKNKKIGAFCGIGYPSQFLELLEACQVVIVNQCVLNDHDLFNEKALERFIKDSLESGAEYILCTQKDFIKLDSAKKRKLPILYLDAELKITENMDIFQNLCARLKAFA